MMKKKILAIVLSVMMLVTLLPMSIFADETTTYVAKIGETGYATLDALVIANNDTVELLMAELSQAECQKLFDKLENLTGVTVKGLGKDATCLKPNINGHITSTKNVTFKDMTIVSNIAVDQYTASISGDFDNVKFLGQISTSGKTSGTEPTFKNCDFYEGTTNYNYLLWVYSGSVVCENCHFYDGSNVKAHVKLYGETGNAIALGMDGCTFDGIPTKGCNILLSNLNNNNPVRQGSVGTKVAYTIDLKDCTSAFTNFYGAENSSSIIAQDDDCPDEEHNLAANISIVNDDVKVFEYPTPTALPVAEVTTYDLTNTTDLAALAEVVGQDGFPICDFSNGVSLSGSGLYTLQIPDCAYKFAATENAGESAYGDWYADYTVSFDNPIAKDSMGLVGYYGSWRIGLGFLAPMEVPANVEIPLLNTMMNSSGWTYDDIINQVGEFYCGAFNLSPANNDTTMTVRLRIFDPDEFDDPNKIQDSSQYIDGQNTYVIEEIQYKLTKNGAMPIGSTQYTVAGTAEDGNPIPAGKYYIDGGSMIQAEEDVSVGQLTAYFTDGTAAVVVDEGKEVTVTTEQTSSVDVTEAPEAIQNVEEYISASTSVTGVQLIAEEENSGIQAIVNEALKDVENAEAIKEADKIEVKVDVVVTPKAYTEQSVLKFDLTPVATLVAKNESGVVTATVKDIEVANEMIDQTQNITVNVFSDFEPKTVLHVADNGDMVSYTKGQTPSGSTFTYDKTAKKVTLIVHHFSDVLLFNEEYVAMIGETGYATLQAAVDAAAAGQTIKMIADVDFGTDIKFGAKVTAGKDVILDLNGKTLEATRVAESSTTIIENHGKLKVVDSGETKGKMIMHSTIDANPFSVTCNAIYNYGDVTIDGAHIESSEARASYAVDTVKGSFTVNSGKIVGSYCAFRVYSQQGDVTFTIKDGEFIGNHAMFVQNSEEGYKLTGTISDGKFQGNKTAGYIWTKTGTPEMTKIDITGGKFKGGSYNVNGDNNYAATLFCADVGTVVLTNGYFTLDTYYDYTAKKYVSLNGLCETGKTIVETAEGAEKTAGYLYTVGETKTYVAQIGETKYETLADALKAAESGSTIEILDGTWGADAIGTLTTAEANQVRYKSLTIQPAEGADVTFTSDVYLGYDDSSTANATMTVKGLNFSGASLKISNYVQVEVDGCHFTNGTTATNGVLVIQDSCCKNHKTTEDYPASQVTVKNCTIDGSNAGAPGIRLRNTGNVALTGNTIANVNHNGILFESNTSIDNTPVKTISITGNTVTEWNAGNAKDGGRAIRISAGSLTEGSEVKITGNTFTKEQLGLDTPDFLKLTGSGSAAVELNGNSWNGELNGTVYNNDAYYTTDSTGTVTLTSTVTEKTPVAQIGVYKYETLAEAIAAVPTDGTETTITMIADTNFTFDTATYATVNSGSNITLDLNGKVITSTSTNGSTSQLIDNRGTLTIKDTAKKDANGHYTGKIIHGANPAWVYDGSGSYNGSYASNLIRNYGGSVTINGGHLENASTASAAYVVDNNNNDATGTTSLIINDGELVAAWTAIRQFVQRTDKENNVTVNGGSVTAARNCFMLNASASNIAKLTINDGTFTTNRSGTSGTSAVVQLWQANTTTTNMAIEINGGCFKAAGGATQQIVELDFTKAAEGEAKKAIRISGGYFNLNDNSLSDYVVADKQVIDTPEGPEKTAGYIYTIGAQPVCKIGDVEYTTLAAAVAADLAASKLDGYTGSKIEMIANEDFGDLTDMNNTGVKIVNGQKITLDLAGYTISGERTNDKSAQIIRNEGNLTIMDSSAKETGCIVIHSGNTTDPWAVSSSAISNGRDLTILSGTIESGDLSGSYGIDSLQNSYSYDVNLWIEGGYIKSQYRGVRLFANGANGSDNLFFTGGVVEGGEAVALWIQNPNGNANKVKVEISDGATMLNPTGNAFSISGNTDNSGIDVSITGGKFYGAVSSPIEGIITGGYYLSIGTWVYDGYRSEPMNIPGGKTALNKWFADNKSTLFNGQEFTIETYNALTAAEKMSYGFKFDYYGIWEGEGYWYPYVYVINENPAFDNYVAKGYQRIANTEGATMVDYPWTIGEEVKPVCKIGETEYNTLAAAVAAANDGDTIVMIANEVLTQTVSINKQITLDLGTFSITPASSGLTPNGKDTKDALIAVNYGGDLTITGTTGKISSNNIASVYAAVKMTEKGEIADEEPARLTVNGGTLEGYYYGITGNGSRHNTEITINGGTVKGLKEDDNTGIYNPQNGKITINGGTVEGSTGIYVKAGTVAVVSGGTIKGTGTRIDFVHSDNGFNSTGDAFVVENCDYPGGTPNVAISGGTFISANASAVASYASNGKEFIKNFITGGTFSSEDVASYCAENYRSEQVGTLYVVSKKTTKPQQTDVATDIQIDDHAELAEHAEDVAKNNQAVNTFVTNDIENATTAYTDEKKAQSNREKIITALDTEAKVQVSAGAEVTAEAALTSYITVKTTGATVLTSISYSVITSKTTVTTMIFDVKPIVETVVNDKIVTAVIPNEAISSPITFRLPVDSNVNTGTIVKVFHNGDPFGEAVVMEENGSKYIELSASSFSEYSYELTKENFSEMVAVLEKTNAPSVYYKSLSAALGDAKASETVRLLADVSNEMFVAVMTGVTLDLNGHNITGATLLYSTGSIIDSASAKGYVSADGYYISESTGYTPIYDAKENGYSFYQLDVTTVSGGYYYRMKKTTERDNAIACLLGNGDDIRIKSAVELHWTEGDQIKDLTITFPIDNMSAYLNNTDLVFSLHFTGTEDLNVVATPVFIIYADANCQIQLAKIKTEGVSWTLD